MSVFMSIHLPRERKDSTFPVECWDHIGVDGHYEFMGLLIDMSVRCHGDPTIPKQPIIKTEQLTQRDLVRLCMADHCDNHIPDQNFYLCRAGQFSKLPEKIDTTQKNNAIVSFMKALDPESFVLFKVSW